MVAGVSFILLDWCILCLFFATLRALWTKPRQFQRSIDNRNETIGVSNGLIIILMQQQQQQRQQALVLKNYNGF